MLVLVLAQKRSQNSQLAKALTHRFKLGKREFPCPFTWIMATFWGKRNQPLGESLANIITPFRVKKTKKEKKKKSAKIEGPESSAC